MATRKARRASKKSAKKKSTRKVAKKAARKAPRKAAKKATKKRAAARPAAQPTVSNTPGHKSRIGVITHTEFASADPAATQAWAERVLGWKFMPPMPMPSGMYHMWSFSNGTGGGIRTNNPPETTGAIPYCEVADIRGAFAKALDAGATEMLAPMEIPGNMGWIAIVSAPGGCAVGFWSMK